MSRGRFLVALLAALLLAGAGAAALLRREPAAPFPSASDIARNGFAVWPVDTVEEAREECADAEGWRKDPKAVALRFASDVLGYPDPSADDDFDGSDDEYRTLIGTDGVKGVFLGSVISVRRFGHCWYVTQGEPREGGRGIDVVTLRGGRSLVVPVGCCGARVEIGWGRWTQTFDSRDRPGEIVVDVPKEAGGAPGHAIVTDFDRNGVSEAVGAVSLPPLPSDRGAQRLAPVDIGARPDDRRLCAMRWSRGGGAPRVIAEVRGVMNGWLDFTKSGYQRFDFRSEQRLGSDLDWRVQLDQADLRVRLAEPAGRCTVLRSIVPRDASIIEQVRMKAGAFTFDIEPGRADEVVVYYGFGQDSFVVSLDVASFQGAPFSASLGPSFNPIDSQGVPAHVFVITYRNGNLQSSEYGLFKPPTEAD